MVDFDECVRRGAVGAAGALPGTLAAHPFDVLKMRQQVSGSSVSSVINSVRGGRTGVASVAAFWQGAFPAVCRAMATGVGDIYIPLQTRWDDTPLRLGRARGACW